MKKEIVLRDEKGERFSDSTSFLVHNVAVGSVGHGVSPKENAKTALISAKKEVNKSGVRSARLVILYKSDNLFCLTYLPTEQKDDHLVTCQLSKENKITAINDSNRKGFIDQPFMQLIKSFYDRKLTVYLAEVDRYNGDVTLTPFRKIQEHYQQQFDLLAKIGRTSDSPPIPTLSPVQKYFIDKLTPKEVREIGADTVCEETKIPLITACVKFDLPLKTVTTLFYKMSELNPQELLLRKDIENDGSTLSIFQYASSRVNAQELLSRKDPENGRTALHYAIRNRNIEVAQWIYRITEGQALFCYDQKGQAPTSCGDEDIQLFFQKYFSVDNSEFCQSEALNRMIINNDADQIDFILPEMKPEQLNSEDNAERNPLCLALSLYATSNVPAVQEKIIESLLKHKADLAMEVYPTIRSSIFDMTSILQYFLELKPSPERIKFIRKMKEQYCPTAKESLSIPIKHTIYGQPSSSSASGPATSVSLSQSKKLDNS